MLPHVPSLRKGDILTEPELDDAVHAVQLWALAKGMIPIAAIISQRVGDKHRVLGFGHNHLAEGIPGIHGETGVILNMGRRVEGYRDLVATSSLNPCPFCQRTLACHLGLREVRILDAENYLPDLSSYPASLAPTVKHHTRTADTFKAWVTDPRHALLWERDIGIFVRPHPTPLDAALYPDRIQAAMNLAHAHAAQAFARGEAPIGAVILDAQGETIGAGHSGIHATNDPTMTAAVSAWRAAGARDQWKDKTLLLTAGPDHIAHAMFKIFNFGQLVVASTAVHEGQLAPTRALGIPTTLLSDATSDAALADWLAAAPPARAAEYLGVLP